MPRVLFVKHLHQCRFHIHEAPHPPFLPRRSTPMLAVRIVGLLAGSGNLDICKKTSYLNVDSNSRTNIWRARCTVAGADLRVGMERNQRVRKAEELVKKAMKGNDASHDAAHVWRVRDLALSLASEEGFSSDPHLMEIVELAALLHDIGDYKYLRDPSEEKTVENFLEEEGVDENKKSKILKIIKGMGFKEEVTGNRNSEWFPELGIVQDADRLDAIGAIGIARCFTFGGSKKMVLHDPSILPRSDLSKEQYMNKEEQTTINHFHEKLLKLKDMMITKAGKRRAERRHKFMEEFVKEFYDEWNGLS